MPPPDLRLESEYHVHRKPGKFEVVLIVQQLLHIVPNAGSVTHSSEKKLEWWWPSVGLGGLLKPEVGSGTDPSLL